MIYETIKNLEVILVQRCGKVTLKSLKLLACVVDNLKDDNTSTIDLETIKEIMLKPGVDDTSNLARAIKSSFNECNLGLYTKLGKFFKFSLNDETIELIQNLSVTSEKLASEFTPDDQISKTLTKESNNKGVTLTSREKSTPAKSIKIENIQCEYDREDVDYAKKRVGSLSDVINAKLKGCYSEETMEAIKHIYDEDDDWIEY